MLESIILFVVFVSTWVNLMFILPGLSGLRRDAAVALNALVISGACMLIMYMYGWDQSMAVLSHNFGIVCVCLSVVILMVTLYVWSRVRERSFFARCAQDQVNRYRGWRGVKRK